MAAVRRSCGAVLAAGALLAGLTACSAAAPRAAGTTPSPSAASSSLATPTDRSPHGVLLAAQLAVRNARRAGFAYKFGAESGKGTLFWAPKTVLQLRRTGTDTQLVVLDTAAYLGGDQATADRLGGRHWEKFTGATGGDGQREIPYADLIDRLSPMVALTAAVAADRPLLVGQEHLQDTAVVHYRVTLETSAYTAAQSQLSASRRQALQTALGGGRLTLDLWLNDNDQLVQLERTAGELDDVISYTEFAGPLSVQAPAETDTVDAGGRSLPPLP